MAMIPLLVARLIAQGGGVLSDTEFMAIKGFEGKILKASFELTVLTNATLVVATITPANNKTFYHYKTNQITTTDFGGADDFVSRLLNNGNFVDAIGGFNTTGGAVALFANSTTVSDFMDGNGSIQYTLSSFNDSVAAIATKGILQGWIEDTGTSPQVPTI